MTQTLITPRFGPVTRHAPRRRRLRRLVLALLLLLAATIAVLHRWRDDAHRDYLSTDGWPAVGQGAYRLGGAPAAASPGERPAPIASLAKVMTAYLVLDAWPLAGARHTLVVRAADVADTGARQRSQQSVVRVAAGERLTERQALLALLLPSANNVAVMLARAVAGSVRAFVARMNAAARTLGMLDTTYTDPSGYDAGTVSTATDQLRLAEAVAGNAAFGALVATRTARLPVVGQVRNTDALLGTDGFVGTKTGSHDAAGGCFMFRTRRVVAGRGVDLIGVVLGQRGHDLIDAGLYAARQLADRVAPQPG